MSDSTTSEPKVVKTVAQSIREKALKSTEKKTIELSLGEAKFEFVQPSLKQVGELQDSAEESDNFVIKMLVEFSFVPGTQERVFLNEDYQAFIDMPFGGEIQGITNKISSMLNLNVENKAKNSEGIPSDGT